MPIPIYLKSSSISSKVPTTSTLSLRELGVNTVDGILYLRQGTGVPGDIIIPINPWKVSTGGTTLYNTFFDVGNVGVGTTNPSQKLHVSGNIRVTGGYYDSNNLVGTNGQVLVSTGSGTTWSANVPNNQTLTFGTYLTGTSYNGSSPITIGIAATSVNTVNNIVVRDASGNFSAGTITAALSGNASTATTLQTTRTLWGQNFNGGANVTGDLTSVGNITGSGALELTATSGTLALTATGANIITASTNSTIRLRIDSTGNVGIAVSPTYRLDVNRGTTGIVARFSGSTQAGLIGVNASGAYFTSDTSGNNAFLADFTGNFSSIFSNGFERLRIDSSGNMGLGTVTPSFRADVSGDIRVQSTNRMRFGGTSTTTNFYIQYNSTANSLDFIAG